jgi:hypothetical protein
MVRRPFERNESSFIESLPRYLSPGEMRDLQSGRQLVELYLDRFDHFEVCTWLDRELQRTTGLDAYEAGELGPGTYRLDRDDRRLLVLSSHVPSERQAAGLADFLGLENVPMRRANVTSEGGFRRIYREFREAVRYPDALRTRILEMRYSRHFRRDFGRVPESR